MAAHAIAEQQQKRARLADKAKAILDQAGKRDLNGEETRRWDAIMRDCDRVTEEIYQTRVQIEGPSLEADRERSAWWKARAESLDPLSHLMQHADRALSPAALQDPGAGGGGWPPLRPGEVRMLGPNELLSRYVQRPGGGASGFAGEQPLSIGRFVRGIVTGQWEGAEPERRAMSEGVLASGGYAVPTPLSAQVIDMARNAAAVMRAGARTIPMESGTLKIARVTSDPAAGWKLENDPAAVSDMTFEGVTLTARTLIGICKLSVELAEDAENIDELVSRALGEALALELDRAALRGSGTPPEPRGLRNTTGVNILSMGANGAALMSYDPISQAVELVAAANGVPNAVIMAPRTAATLDRLKDTTNQPLRPPPSYEGLRQKLVTKQLPVNLTHGTATNASEVYVGDWTSLWIGVRTQLILEASRQAADATDSAFRQLQVWLRAYLRADVAVAQPAHFTVITGVIP